MWYRGARFGADLDTIHNLSRLGYKYDSSITPHIDWTSKGEPDHGRALGSRYPIAIDNMYCEGDSGIIEVPVTILGKKWGLIGRLLPDNWLFYKWLQSTHMTYLEIKQSGEEVE